MIDSDYKYALWIKRHITKFFKRNKISARITVYDLR